MFSWPVDSAGEDITEVEKLISAIETQQRIKSAIKTPGQINSELYKI